LRKLKDCLNATLIPFQKKGVLYALNHNYLIIGDEMGLGKTIQGISVSLSTQLPTLVVCPAYLKLTWLNEFEKFSVDKLKIKVLTAGDYGADGDEDVIIGSYSTINKFVELFGWAGLIIADESHYLKNPNTKRSKAFIKGIEDNRPERLILLSGTPIKNGSIEWYTPIYLCSLNKKRNSGPILGDYIYSYIQFC